VIQGDQEWERERTEYSGMMTSRENEERIEMTTVEE
jgi:hypothetical protein